MSSVKEIYDFIDGFAPFSSQQSWDNSGLLIDCGRKDVGSVLLALDATEETVAEAARSGCTLIVSHHPVIFHPLTALLPRDAACLCLQAGISVICAHTNFDLAPCGTSGALAEKLRLENVVCDENGFLQLGELPAALSAEDFAAFVKARLGAAAVRYNTVSHPIRRAAVCAGAGADFLPQAKEAGADALVTGDGKHHEFMDAKQSGLALVAAGHYETELPGVRRLRKLLADRFLDVEFRMSDEGSPVIHI